MGALNSFEYHFKLNTAAVGRMPHNKKPIRFSVIAISFANYNLFNSDLETQFFCFICTRFDCWLVVTHMPWALTFFSTFQISIFVSIKFTLFALHVLRESKIVITHVWIHMFSLALFVWFGSVHMSIVIRLISFRFVLVFSHTRNSYTLFLQLCLIWMSFVHFVLSHKLYSTSISHSNQACTLHLISETLAPFFITLCVRVC